MQLNALQSPANRETLVILLATILIVACLLYGVADLLYRLTLDLLYISDNYYALATGLSQPIYEESEHATETPPLVRDC